MFATAYFQFEIVYGKVDDVQCFGCGIKYFNQGLLYELWPNDENSIIGRLFFHQHPADNLCRECPESNIFDFPELKPISLLSSIKSGEKYSLENVQSFEQQSVMLRPFLMATSGTKLVSDPRKIQTHLSTGECGFNESQNNSPPPPGKTLKTPYGQITPSTSSSTSTSSHGNSR